MSEKRRGWRGEKGRKRERKDRRARGRGAEAPGPCALLSPGRRSRSHLVGAHAQKRHDLKCRDLKRRDLKRRDLRCSLDPLFWVQAVAGRAPDRLHRLRGKPATPPPLPLSRLHWKPHSRCGSCGAQAPARGIRVPVPVRVRHGAADGRDGDRQAVRQESSGGGEGHNTSGAARETTEPAVLRSSGAVMVQRRSGQPRPVGGHLES